MKTERRDRWEKRANRGSGLIFFVDCALATSIDHGPYIYKNVTGRFYPSRCQNPLKNASKPRLDLNCHVEVGLAGSKTGVSRLRISLAGFLYLSAKNLLKS
jgi:hypothetical protein